MDRKDVNGTRPTHDASAPRFVARFAADEAEVMESLRLRYRIFAEELGAKLETAAAGIDADPFDLHCRHLIVRDNWSGEMVASTRLLTETEASAAGGFYSQGEFELGFLQGLSGRKMEVGRTCVAPAFRNGTVIATLWSRLAACVVDEGIDYLFGCASIGLDEGPDYARAVMNHLRGNYLSPDAHRVEPRCALPALGPVTATHTPRLPPLVKAYVSLGARACGEAYWDQDFNCLDVFMLLDVARLEPRYRRRFLAAPERADALAHAA
jgi:putative hemolysin